MLLTTTRILFFTGKGGVGKTSLACATALALAEDHDKRVLLVSTDPASNLDEVLDVPLDGAPKEVPGTNARLFALNIDPEAAARAYRERVVGPYRGLLPEAAITSMEEQLSGACTVEIAAFDEFTKLLGDPAATAGFDHIVFDTAPTGHTLRLLQLPAAWTGFMNNNTTGTSCLGPLSGLAAQKSLYEQSLRALADPRRTTLYLVSRPEPSALREAERSRRELAALGLANQHLLLNAVFTASDPHDPAAAALEARGRAAIAAMPEPLSHLPRTEFQLLARAPMGLAGLRSIFNPQPPASPEPETQPVEATNTTTLHDLIDDLESTNRGVILTMGKGGVGKTTIAAAIAVELAARGRQVHLSTTDPAAHIADVAGTTPGLTLHRIDPKLETARYTQEVLDTAGANLTPEGRALLEEDLRSPCTEEIAVFRAFAQTVEIGASGFVVLDTAPTGHTLLLLDAAEAYHREVLRTQSAMPDAVRNLLPRLRDPRYTKVLIVTLPEATPVHEAARLQQDLHRAGIATHAWIINQSFSAASRTFRDPILAERARRELPFLREVREQLASQVVTVPWTPVPPVGPGNLRNLVSVPL